jgi:signal transduction histidine kinase
MKSVTKVLLIEDNIGDTRLIREMLRTQGEANFEFTHMQCMRDAEQHLATFAIDIILLDLGLPDSQGLEAVQRVRAAAPKVPLMVITGLDEETLAAQALRAGAQDYLIKGQVETRSFSRAVRYAIERKTMEVSRDRLEQLKDEFVASVSHELRTPLTSICASLSLMMAKAEAANPESMARLLKIAHNNSQRLLQLVNDILDVEKLESGRVLFNFRRVAIRPLLEEVFESNQGFAARHCVKIRLESSDHAVDDVRADPDRLFQVMTNLLSNAIKFSPNNGVVTVAVKMNLEDVEISVRDHGLGIAPEFKPRVFERFSQADGADSRQNDGTGLGLSIVKQIVDRLKGEVWFSDAPGGGTIFHLKMPSWTRVAQQAVDRSAVPDAVRVLLCDDDVDSAILMREQLMPFSICTDFSYTMAEAITCATIAQYDAGIVDLNLPDGDGVKLIMQLREMAQYQHTPIIVLSVDPSVGRRDLRSLNLNVSDWLYKPVDVGRLVKLFVGPVASNADKRPTILHIADDEAPAKSVDKMIQIATVH